MAKRSAMRSPAGLLAALLLLLPAAVRAADTAPQPPLKPEICLLLPEPRSMRSALSKTLAEARSTVFTPAHSAAGGKLSTYSAAEFAKLGIGWETFRERAEAAADRLLAARSPELKKDEAGNIIYAVYRGDETVMTCLLTAPSLGQVFKKVFGDEIWIITPDRNSLYVFPAKAEAIADFTDDLRTRFRETPFAASEEIFLRKEGAGLKAIGSLPP